MIHDSTKWFDFIKTDSRQHSINFVAEKNQNNKNFDQLKLSYSIHYSLHEGLITLLRV